MQGSRAQKRTLMNIIMGSLLVFYEVGEIRKVHKSLQEIQAHEGLLNLTLIREWSGEHEEDEKDNLYAAAIYRPLIQKYAPAGNLQMESIFDVPFKVPEVKPFRRAGGVFIEAEAVSRGIDVDARGRIYLPALTRLKSPQERRIGWVISTIGGTGKVGKTEKMKFDVNPAETDLYQILVFDNSGKIVASKKLNIYANHIKLYKDRLFLIDTYVNMKIYEYNLSDG
jgi:hypothetical protein